LTMRLKKILSVRMMRGLGF